MIDSCDDEITGRHILFLFAFAMVCFLSVGYTVYDMAMDYKYGFPDDDIVYTELCDVLAYYPNEETLLIKHNDGKIELIEFGIAGCVFEATESNSNTANITCYDGNYAIYTYVINAYINSSVIDPKQV